MKFGILFAMKNVCTSNVSTREVSCGVSQLEFAIFCVEYVAERLGVPSRRIFDALKQSGLLEEYVIASYDVLHTQSKEYIVDDICRVMKLKGVTV